jgi:hypothetical protein
MHIGEVPKILLSSHRTLEYDTPLGPVVDCRTCGAEFVDLIEHSIFYTHHYKGGDFNERMKSYPKLGSVSNDTC